MCMCVYCVYVRILCTRMYVCIPLSHWFFTGSLKILLQSSWRISLGEIPLCWVNGANKWFLLLLDPPVFARTRFSIGGRCLGLRVSFYYHVCLPSILLLLVGLSQAAAPCPSSLRFPAPQLLLEHQDAYQAGAVFPDAFYPSICERGKVECYRPRDVTFT